MALDVYICRSLIVFFVIVIMNKLNLQNHSSNEKLKITITSKTFPPHYYMNIHYCNGPQYLERLV